MNTLTNQSINPVREAVLINNQIKQAEKALKEAKAKLNNILDDLGVEELEQDGYTVKRILAERKAIDGKLLKEECPDLYSKYLKSTAYIQLRLA